MLKGLIFTVAAAASMYAAANSQDPVIRILICACSTVAVLVIGYLWGIESTLNINQKQ